jgi:hypothetical protein
MIAISKKIVTQMQDFLRNANKNIDQYGQKKTAFTRTRKLPFKQLCNFLSKLLKKVYKQHSMIFLKTDLLVPNLPSAKLVKN